MRAPAITTTDAATSHSDLPSEGEEKGALPRSVLNRGRPRHHGHPGNKWGFRPTRRSAEPIHTTQMLTMSYPPPDPPTTSARAFSDEVERRWSTYAEPLAIRHLGHRGNRPPDTVPGHSDFVHWIDTPDVVGGRPILAKKRHSPATSRNPGQPAARRGHLTTSPIKEEQMEVQLSYTPPPRPAVREAKLHSTTADGSSISQGPQGSVELKRAQNHGNAPAWNDEQAPGGGTDFRRNHTRRGREDRRRRRSPTHAAATKALAFSGRRHPPFRRNHTRREDRRKRRSPTHAAVLKAPDFPGRRHPPRDELRQTHHKPTARPNASRDRRSSPPSTAECAKSQVQGHSAESMPAEAPRGRRTSSYLSQAANEQLYWSSDSSPRRIQG